MHNTDDKRVEVFEDKQVRPDVTVASRWRRLIATFIDTLIIVLPLFILGQIFTEQVTQLGSFGIFIGVLTVATYYGICDSCWCNGQTLGKRIFSIQTLTLNGNLLSPQRAAFRALILYAPVLLADIELGKGILNEVEKFILLLILLLLATLIYLFFLNMYHRSVHDMATATIVVKRSSPVPAISPVWSGHYAGIALFSLISLVPFQARLPLIHYGGQSDRLVHMLETHPEVRSASVTYQLQRRWTSDATLDLQWIQVNLEVTNIFSPEPALDEIKQTLMNTLGSNLEGIDVVVVKSRTANLGLVTLNSSFIQSSPATNPVPSQ